MQLKKNAAGSDLLNTTQLIINGTEIAISTIEQNANTSSTLSGVSDELLFTRSASSLTVIFSSGVSVAVKPSNVSNVTRMYLVPLLVACSLLGQSN